METLNLDAVEQQQIIITVALNNSDGTPADLTQYACYAASVGQQDPYTRRAPRKEWAAAINNESSAYILAAPGLEIAAAPWRYSIYLKDRKLGLEWVICTGRITLTPRACGTDGISPAAYSISAECTPSGLVNVSLDATVGSISGTLEEVKASAALASTSAANAHADLEDARKAASTAAQAATAAAADAKTAAESATRAEQAATDAPQACAPFVGQVQAAAVQAQQAATHAEEDANRASTAATTATEKAQIATDAAAAAATASSDLASARDTAVQAATTAQSAQQTAQLASTTATTAAENAREYAEDAQQAQQAAATSETTAATAAQQASDSASAAAASAQSAQTSAATAASAKQDLETARDTATAAATTATDAATAAATSESNATAAATAAATAQAAAEAAQAQADTDARACAIYDQRAAANATAAANSATAAANSATAAKASETAAAASATEAAASATDALLSEYEYAAVLYAATKEIPDGVYYAGLQADGSYGYCIIKNVKNAKIVKSKVIITHGDVTWSSAVTGGLSVLYTDDSTYIGSAPNLWGVFGNNSYIHAPRLIRCKRSLCQNSGMRNLTFSPSTKFEQTVSIAYLFNWKDAGTINWAPGTTMSSPIYAEGFCEQANIPSGLPDEFTFANVTDARGMFLYANMPKLPASMNLSKCVLCNANTFLTPHIEIEDIVRVCLTLPDLTQLETPKTCPLGLSVKTRHDGNRVEITEQYLNANHPDFLITMAARGWTVVFS